MSGRDAGWRISTLSNVGVTLIDCVHATPTEASSGYPYVAIPQMKSGRIDFTDARLITPEDFAEWTRKAKPQRHDVVLSRRTNPGVTATDYEGRDFAVGQNLVLLRADGSKMYPPFLKWLCRGPEWWVQINKNLNVGAVFDSLKCADVPNFELTIPPLAEQRAIAAVLGALDDKIEANRRMSVTLEALTRAIYDSTIADEFSDAMLGDVCEIFDGPHATPKTVDEGPIFLGISNLSDGQLDLSDTRHVTEEDYARWTRRVTPSPCDVLFSYETRLGQAAWLPAGIRCCLGRRMGILRAYPSKVPPIMLFHAYVSSAFQETIREKTVHGSTVERIPLVEMPSFAIRIPSAERCKVLAPTLLAMRERICLNAAMTESLAQLRDLLLPKLLSGTLRVPDAEEMVEDAA